MAKRRNYKNLNYFNIFLSVVIALVVIVLLFSGVKMLFGSVMAMFSPEKKPAEIPEITTAEPEKTPADENATKTPAEEKPTTTESASQPADENVGEEKPLDNEETEEVTPPAEESPAKETTQEETSTLETTIYGVKLGGNLEANMNILKQQGKDSKVLKRYVYQPESGVIEAIDGDVVTLVVDVLLTKEKVMWLQEQLKIAGYYTTRDGGFGQNTRATLAKYTEEVMGKKTELFTSDVEASLEENNKNKMAGDINDFEVLVNKEYNLLASAVPNDIVTPSVLHQNYVKGIRSEVNDKLTEMFTAAQKDGIALRIESGYRDYNYQTTLFDGYTSREGFEAANKYSALPGQSEHQTGLAVDLADVSGNHILTESFETTAAFKWLDEHAADYGFILRFPKDKVQFTKYIYEPWHYRYVGSVELAKYIKKNNLSFEEYKLTQGQ